MRQSPEQDELHLLEEAEPDDSDIVMEDEVVQLRKERRRRSTATDKRISSSDVSGFFSILTLTAECRKQQLFVYPYFHLHSLFL